MLQSMSPRARRATFVAFMEKVDPNAEDFDMRDVTETFAQSLDPPMQGVSFLRLLLEELEDRGWSVPQPLVDRLLSSLPPTLREHLSDELIYVRVPQNKWRLFRPADWAYERQIVEGHAKRKSLTILHVDVERQSAPFGQERMALLLEADDLTWVEQRFRLIHRRVDYDDEDEQERLLSRLFGPSVLEPLIDDALRMWFHRDRRITRSTVRLERWPQRFADLARPSFELSLTVIFEPASVDQQGLVRRLKEIMGKVI
jgi:hypothetical protein